MIAAGLESLLIFLVFIVISGLSTWLQKRRQAGEDQGEWGPGEEGEDPAHPPARRQGAPQAPPIGQPRPLPAPLQNWEAELRRLLGGEQEQPLEPPPQAAPPPLPSRSSRPQPVSMPAHLDRDFPAAAQHVESEGPRVSRLEDSQRAYRRARQQQAEAAARLREAQAKTARHQGAYRQTTRSVRGADIRAARGLLSSPSSARQAVIVSVILGQPKGLE